jgi:DNA-directed RNA polymerase subunit RPC12/RpoP
VALAPGWPGAAVVAILRRRLACGLCLRFEAEERAAVLEHLATAHRGELLDEARLQDLAAVDRRWPASIYRCSYCGHYVPDTVASQTTEIQRHIEEDCPKAGPPPRQVRFEVVLSLDEIRRHVLADLPLAVRCGRCGEMLTAPTREGLDALWREHLAGRHPQLVREV